MLQLCGETEEKLGQELIQFEFQIERDVVEPLYVLAEVSTDQDKAPPWHHCFTEPLSLFYFKIVKD